MIVLAALAILQTKRDPIVVEFLALKDSMEREMSGFVAAQTGPIDWTASPLPQAIAKLTAFAKRADSHPLVGPEVHVMILESASQLPSGRTALQDSIGRLQTTFIRSDAFGDRHFQAIRLAAETLWPSEPSRAANLLGLFAAKSPHPTIRARAAYHQALVQDDLKVWAKLAADHPMSSFGRMAAGRIFRQSKLGFDQIAPNFAANDTEGKKFWLNDYRSRQVILLFHDESNPASRLWLENPPILERTSLIVIFRSKPVQPEIKARFAVAPELFERWGILQTPSIFFLAPGGRISEISIPNLASR